MNNDTDTRKWYHYTPFYCEENIWHLAKDEQFAASHALVVFISNERRQCPLWWQRACRKPDEPVLWDYHTILLVRDPKDFGRWQVWDLDTQLGMPLAPSDYFVRTFLHAGGLIPGYEPMFKVIDSKYYIANLSSDRLHMRTEDGGWTMPPPSWPLILNGRSNLQEFIDMRDATHGEVLDLFNLVQRLAEL